MEQVRFLARYTYSAQKDVHFDSDVGEFTAVIELGRPDAEYWEHWNSQKDLLERTRAELGTMCRSSYWGIGSFVRQQRGHTAVRWFRNGQEEEAGVVSTGLIPNGDWTFQTMVMLETVPRSGEVYTCHVEHPSRTSPVTVEWRAQSECAQSKMLSGIGGFVLGLLFLGVGLFIYFRNQKEHPALQPTGLLR
ncbi:HLA class II histocompatibility antigen, DRB1 beta chain-like isoform X4 [Kogia breviceps]|uniref:HLA class II histocompatibility antigen, DRB1 beta chain-like isoform X4 n=1 Tax=Kogia breviceps TaxID=27615 RepID=UPI0034D2C741